MEEILLAIVKSEYDGLDWFSRKESVAVGGD
jgi:hypothetical protein